MDRIEIKRSYHPPDAAESVLYYNVKIKLGNREFISEPDFKTYKSAKNLVQKLSQKLHIKVYDYVK